VLSYQQSRAHQISIKCLSRSSKIQENVEWYISSPGSKYLPTKITVSRKVIL
jgi:hypothetical protein